MRPLSRRELLPALQALSLSGTGCDDLTGVASLPALRRLHLAGNSALSHLQLGVLMGGMGCLEELSLAACPGVADGVWEALSQMTGLRSLDLSSCANITAGGRQRAQREVCQGLILFEFFFYSDF